MDPRIWELVGLDHGTIYIQETTLYEGGSTITVTCHAVNEYYPDGRGFKLVFRGCKEIQCQVLDPKQSADYVEALGMFLGECNYGKPAVVYTGTAEMSVKYSEIEVTD